MTREVTATAEGAAFGLLKLPITRLLLDDLRGVLIAGTRTGHVFLFAWPFKRDAKGSGSSTVCYARYAVHDGAVTSLELMRESGVLFTTGADGNMFVIDVAKAGEREKEAKRAAMSTAAGDGEEARTDRSGEQTATTASESQQTTARS